MSFHKDGYLGIDNHRNTPKYIYLHIIASSRRFLLTPIMRLIYIVFSPRGRSPGRQEPLQAPGGRGHRQEPGTAYPAYAGQESGTDSEAAGCRGASNTAPAMPEGHSGVACGAEPDAVVRASLPAGRTAMRAAVGAPVIRRPRYRRAIRDGLRGATGRRGTGVPTDRAEAGNPCGVHQSSTSRMKPASEPPNSAVASVLYVLKSNVV